MRVVRATLRLVLDTNILLRGLLNERSASGRILAACENRAFIPLLSLPVLVEYRGILTDPELVERYPQLDEHRVRAVLERLAYVGDVVRRVRVRFRLARDPKDAKLVELAIAARATHVVTTDRDLLDLATGRDDAARRFRQRLPGVLVIQPVDFWERFGGELKA